MASEGPSINNILLEWLGMISSLKNNFPPSASGYKMPKVPARFGPILSCIKAAIFLSAYVSYIATTSDAITIIAIRINFSRRRSQSIVRRLIIGA